jgi:hypothetical protein
MDEDVTFYINNLSVINVRSLHVLLLDKGNAK